MPPRSLRAVLWTLAAALIVVFVPLVRRPAPARSVLGSWMRPWAEGLVAAVQVAPPPPAAPSRCPPEPPLAVDLPELPSGLELVRRIREAPDELGSASIGAPNHGRLWGAARLLPSDDIQPEGDQPWGTASVVRSIERAAREVRRCFPDTPRLFVGDISRKEGGWLKPHRSHQSGLDADIGYYYADGEGWFMTATAANLDRPRTWALVRALVEGGNVESMFIDHAVQRLLRDYAASLAEPGPRLEDLFESKERKHDVVIHHASGHATHFHVRFRDPAAAALGARLATLMTVPRAAPPTRPARASTTGPKAR